MSTPLRASAASWWSRLRFFISWAVAVALVVVVLPRLLDISWVGILEQFEGLGWKAVGGLTLLWLAGLISHTFVLVAAAPDLSHRRALTLNLTGSAVANVVPMGGAAGVELNRRMMRAWGIDTKTFTGYTFLTNLWDVASKFLLPVIAVLVLANGERTVSGTLTWTAVGAALGFIGVCAFGVLVLRSPRCTVAVGRFTERIVWRVSTLLRRPRRVDLVSPMLEIRRESAGLVRGGWAQMSLGMTGYVALQGVLLWLCLDLTNSGAPWAAVLVGYAVERLLTVLPITPGGVGLADLGLVGVLIALGGDPTGVAAGAVLYRAFVFAIEIPVGGGALGLWVLDRWRHRRRADRAATLRAPEQGARIAHVTDVFLPRLGGIETHVDDLVRHQRAAGREVEVLTPISGNGDDPGWVRRVSTRRARRMIGEYDIVHAHISIVSPFALRVVTAAIRAGVPVVVTVHSMWAGAGMPVRLAGLAALRRWPVVWSAVSGAAARVFERAMREEVSVLSNAVDVADWVPRPGEVTQHAPGADDPVTVVSVMRLANRKRPVELLKAFHRATVLASDRELRLVMVGDGAQRGRLERYIARHGLGEQVTITGRIPREQVRAHLMSSSLYVAPARKEAFGIAALEARCVGLPVIAARQSGVSEFVRDRIEGILVDDDQQLAAAMAELAHDHLLRARITAHNRRVRPPHDWSDALVRIDEEYRAAMALVADVTYVDDLVDLDDEASAEVEPVRDVHLAGA